MSDIGKRMGTLREGIGLSQAKFGKIDGPPGYHEPIRNRLLCRSHQSADLVCADYFDVSMIISAAALKSSRASCTSASPKLGKRIGP